MSSYFLNVLILGHSFVKPLHRDLQSGFDHRAQLDFNLANSAVVHLNGFGGCTVSQLKEKDLFVISHLVPTLVTLEIGTNDILSARPKVIGLLIWLFLSTIISSVSYWGLRGYPSSASRF